MTKYAHIVGWGKGLPSNVLTNEDMAKIVDTSDEWIRSHTGIAERRIAGPDDTVATLSVTASRQALERAGISPEELDLVLVATSSPDYQLPGASFLVQAELGANRAAAFDVRAGCSGFVCALALATGFIATQTYRHILVVGAEIVSICLDWSDRRTCCIFGDGAGAVVVQGKDEPGGVISFALGSDGSQAEALCVRGAGSKYPLCPKVFESGRNHLELNGQALLKFALRAPLQGMLRVIEGAGLTVADIDLFVPSQSNRRLIEALCKTLGIPLEKVFINIDKYANTSAASVPIALCEALEEGRAKKGDKIALFAYGAGLSWAAAVVQMGATQASPLLVSWPIWNRARSQLDRARVMVKTAGAALAANASALLLPFLTRSDKNE